METATVETKKTTDERIKAIEEQLFLREQTSKDLSKVVRILWWLLIGSFSLGGWVATIHLKQSAQTEAISEYKALFGEHELRLREQERIQASQNATTVAKLEAIINTMERIDTKLNQ